MKTEAAASLYLAQHLIEWEGKGHALSRAAVLAAWDLLIADKIEEEGGEKA